jgi:hypothetical protein
VDFNLYHGRLVVVWTTREAIRLKIVTASRLMLNPVALPGMGKSIELFNLLESEAMEIRMAYGREELLLQFEGESEVFPVQNLWPDPHDLTRLTLFIR